MRCDLIRNWDGDEQVVLLEKKGKNKNELYRRTWSGRVLTSQEKKKVGEAPKGGEGIAVNPGARTDNPQGNRVRMPTAAARFRDELCITQEVSGLLRGGTERCQLGGCHASRLTLICDGKGAL